MTQSVIRVFRSDVEVMTRLLARWASTGTLMVVIVSAIGQWRTGRFLDYGGLGLALVIVPAACLALWIFFYLAALIFPVKLITNGIRCYDTTGRYQSVKWSDVVAVDFINMYGLRYIAIYAPTIKQPITVPLYLRGMTEFRQLVESQAGPDNMVVKALHEATT